MFYIQSRGFDVGSPADLEDVNDWVPSFEVESLADTNLRSIWRICQEQNYSMKYDSKTDSRSNSETDSCFETETGAEFGCETDNDQAIQSNNVQVFSIIFHSFASMKRIIFSNYRHVQGTNWFRKSPLVP